jgi:murein DD-endopeptidase MepM/ murein hydrolase activator NlpD
MEKCKAKEKALKNIYCLTQYFGSTDFARSGAYNGSDHNGIDFGVSTGTRVISALAGTVTATGNTDLVRGCYSYGKWVLIKHANGLSTLYAHLSVISVSQGQVLETGDSIGFSGATGYATGPHLHFTVYASDGVRLVKMGDIKAKTSCAAAVIPVAPTDAYLNPMQYL